MVKQTKKSNQNLQEQKSIQKKKKTGKKKQNQQKQKQVTQKEEKFSFDQEMIIGVIKNPENQKGKMKNPKKRNKKKQKQPKKEVSRRTVLILKYASLGILFIILVISAMFSPLFNIKQIQVEGNKRITANEIISLSQIQTDQNIFKISNYKTKKQIKENAYINKVTITRKLPSTLILKVEEREPAYLLEYAGSYLYVDKQGYFLQMSQEKLELPILQEAVTPTEDFIVR